MSFKIMIGCVSCAICRKELTGYTCGSDQEEPEIYFYVNPCEKCINESENIKDVDYLKNLNRVYLDGRKSLEDELYRAREEIERLCAINRSAAREIVRLREKNKND